MWRWTAIIGAAFLYIPARYMISNFVGTTTVSDAIVVNTVPLVIALVFLGIIVFAVK